MALICFDFILDFRECWFLMLIRWFCYGSFSQGCSCRRRSFWWASCCSIWDQRHWSHWSELSLNLVLNLDYLDSGLLDLPLDSCLSYISTFCRPTEQNWSLWILDIPIIVSAWLQTMTWARSCVCVCVLWCVFALRLMWCSWMMDDGCDEILMWW